MNSLDCHDNDISLSEGLIAIFDPLLYSKEDIRTAVAVMLVLGGVDMAAVPLSLKVLMLEFALKVKTPGSDTPEGARKAMDDYFRKHPINTELMARVRELVTENFLKNGRIKTGQLHMMERLLSSDLTSRTAPTLEQLHQRPYLPTKAPPKSRAGRRQFTLT